MTSNVSYTVDDQRAQKHGILQHWVQKTINFSSATLCSEVPLFDLICSKISVH